MAQTVPPLPNGMAAQIASRLVQFLIFGWRHTAQVVVGVAVTWLVAHTGLEITDELRGWLELGLFALGVAAVGWAQHWLETRRGLRYPRLAQLARGLARLMVLGAPGVPQYAMPAPGPALRIPPNTRRV